LTFATPVVNFQVLRERSFAVSCGITFGAFAVLYAASVALPLLLLTWFGYDAYAAGRVLWPAGVFCMLTLLVVSRLIGWGIDARWLIASGLLIMAAGNYWMVLMNLYISPSQAIWPRVVTIVGLSLMVAPLNVAAFLYIPKHLRGAAVGLLALVRNEGCSFGVTMLQTLQERRGQFHLSRLTDGLDPYNSQVDSFLDQGQEIFLETTGDAALAQELALQALDNLRQQQAASFAFFDVFWVAAVASLALVFLVFLMKRSVAEKSPNKK
jgi:MFS transporter, DHA2 family, multidrug resistance protein